MKPHGYRRAVRFVVGVAVLLQPLYPQASYTCTSTSFGQFNKNPISGSSSIWFTAWLTPSGTPSSPAEVSVNWFMISFGQQSNGFPYQCHNYAPVSTIKFSNPPEEATLTYLDSTNSWTANIPLQLGGNTFLAGCTVPPCSAQINYDCIPSGGLPGSLAVTWTIQFQTTADQAISWQWGAAVYSQFAPCKESEECQGFGPLGIKPVDSSSMSKSCIDSSSDCQVFANTDSAGTPENYKQHVVTGGTGNGGTNYTGTGTWTQVRSCTPNESPCQTALLRGSHGCNSETVKSADGRYRSSPLKPILP